MDNVETAFALGLRGFRKRWVAGNSELDTEKGADDGLCGEEPGVSSSELSFEQVAADDSFPESLSQPEASSPLDMPKELEHFETHSHSDVVGDMPAFDTVELETAAHYQPDPFESRPLVVDKDRTETNWQREAMQATSKRLKLSSVVLPWEQPGFGSLFGSTAPSSMGVSKTLDALLMPTEWGRSDVLNSQQVTSRMLSSPMVEGDKPVVKLVLKKFRHEALDEDIRRMAMLKLRDLITQDPLATQLGTSLHQMSTMGDRQEIIEQSFYDCFRTKASSTLQKRASSLWKLASILRELGQFNLLRLSESQLYEALCKMRTAGCGATTAQHVIEALHFLDSTAKLCIVDIGQVISGRCRGVARDMYLTKNPLQQKQPLSVAHVRYLEAAIHTLKPHEACIAGQLLFCIHSCCRWRDAQRLKDISLEQSQDESLVFANALTSKTAVTLDARTRFLPYVALGHGVSGMDWAQCWLNARKQEGLGFGEFSLPSYSERSSGWVNRPMSASEATAWMREFLGLTSAQASQYGSHSCKTTLLTWAGRCTQINMSHVERRLLGHHMDPGTKSMLCYSKESFTNLYARVLQMFRLIRSGEFKPDESALSRIINMSQAADLEPEVGHADEVVAPVSDSESSIASEGSIHPDMSGQPVGDEGATPKLVTLMPGFPGVPESSLRVHKVSGLVHVVNEDDTLACGRSMSANFILYARTVGSRQHLEGCRQCIRAFGGGPGKA